MGLLARKVLRVRSATLVRWAPRETLVPVAQRVIRGRLEQRVPPDLRVTLVSKALRASRDLRVLPA